MQITVQLKAIAVLLAVLAPDDKSRPMMATGDTSPQVAKVIAYGFRDTGISITVACN